MASSFRGISDETKPLKVGVTGGIGSGKSTVCRLFEDLGIPVYDADERAKWLMTHNPSLKKNIVEAFGTESYLDDGSLNRIYLADKVFNQPDQLKQINSLVHPVVREDGLQWHHMQKNVPYTLKEAALLIESGSYQDLDVLILVTAPLDLRIQRVALRNGIDAEAVQKRINHQWDDDEKRKKATFVIENSGTIEELKKQIEEIHHKILEWKTGA